MVIVVSQPASHQPSVSDRHRRVDFVRIVQEIYSNIHLDFRLERDYFRCRCDIITNTLENEIPAIALWSSPQKCRRQRGEFPQSQYQGRFEPVQRNAGFLQTTHVTDNEFHSQERRVSKAKITQDHRTIALVLTDSSIAEISSSSFVSGD